jgi:hypothetical protein
MVPDRASRAPDSALVPKHRAASGRGPSIEPRPSASPTPNQVWTLPRPTRSLVKPRSFRRRPNVFWLAQRSPPSSHQARYAAYSSLAEVEAVAATVQHSSRKAASTSISVR